MVTIHVIGGTDLRVLTAIRIKYPRCTIIAHKFTQSGRKIGTKTYESGTDLPRYTGKSKSSLSASLYRKKIICNRPYFKNS